MKKFIAITLLLFFSFSAFPQFKWTPLIDDYGQHLAKGIVHALYNDSSAGGTHLLIGRDNDSSDYPYSPNILSSSAFFLLNYSPSWPNYLFNVYECYPWQVNHQYYTGTVLALSATKDFQLSGEWFACAGRFTQNNCVNPGEDDAYNIDTWWGSVQACGYYWCPIYENYMDTVFAIAWVPDNMWCSGLADFKMYVAAKCVFCSSLDSITMDSSRYIGFYDPCQNGNYTNTYNFMQGGTNGPVYSIVAIDTANVYAGGRFDSAGVIKANNIAKWNGASWDSLGSGVNGTVKAMLNYNNKLYVGGNFTMAGGASANNIAVWDGSNWAAIGTGTNGIVYALTIHNGDLYAGGAFTQAGGNAANHIAHWNGTQWSDVGGGRNDEVYALASFIGDLYAGGKFLGGTNDTARYIARYTDTTLVSVNSQFSIYPNPTNGVFVVAVAGGSSSNSLPAQAGQHKIEIYNVYGEKIQQLAVGNMHGSASLTTGLANNSQIQIDGSTPITINLSEQPDGIYFVRIETEKGVIVKKIILVR